MIDTPATSRPVARYRLTTFGTLALAGPRDNRVLGSHGHHRRRLALLAVVAAAGERGRSRDQLLALFWPEATQSRARHALEQLLYSLRSSIDESVFATSNPVSLSPEVVESDVDVFNGRLERDDPEAAVDEYRGPFLDGFYLEDAPEFERWVDAQRGRLARRMTGALAALATQAVEAGEHRRAADLWQRAVEVDPFDSQTALAHVLALAGGGDRAGALVAARRHEALLKRELGVGPDPSFAEAVARLR